MQPSQTETTTMASQPLSAMANTNTNPKLHIAMLPWLAFGHIIPYLELAKLLAQKGHKISFISTPKNINRLPKIPPQLTTLINLIKIPLPQVENLPQNAEATTDLPYDKVQYLKIAYDAMSGCIEQFLEVERPDWVFYDFAPYWVGPIAARLGILSAFFTIFTAACLGFLGPVKNGNNDRKLPEGLTVPPKWVPFETTVAYRLYEVFKIIDSFTGHDSGVTDLYRFQASVEGCDLLAVRSCSEFEPEWLKLLQELHQKTVIPVGQLPPTAHDSSITENDESWLVTKKWLDKQEKGSVVYVAFGRSI